MFCSFDCDKNMMPCSTNGGSTAHWALLCGVIVERPNIKQKSLFTNNTVQSNSDEALGTNYMANKKHLSPARKAEKLDVNRIWVVVRHGKKGGRYDVWRLKDLDLSNSQLRTPSEKILRNIPSSILAFWELDPFNNRRCNENIHYPPLMKAQSVLKTSQKHETSSGMDPEQQRRNLKLNASEFHSTYSVEKLSEENVVAGSKDSWADWASIESYMDIPVERMLPWDISIKTEPETPELEQTVLSDPVEDKVQTNSKSLPPLPQLLPSLKPPNLVTRYEFHIDENDGEPPFVLPEGPELDQCLANKYVAFEPEIMPYFITEFNENTVKHDVKSHVSNLYFFYYFGSIL